MEIKLEPGAPDGILVHFNNLYVDTYEEAFVLIEAVEAVKRKQKEHSMGMSRETYEKIINCLLDPGDIQADRVESALSLALEAAVLKEDLDQLFDLLRLFFKKSMLASLHGSDKKSNQQQVDANILRARERWNLEQLSDKVQVIDFVAKTLARNCNRQMACEVLFLKLLSIK